MGAPRYARPGDRLRTPLERADRDRGADVHSLAGPGLQQVLRLASALRPGERTQRLDPARLLAGREGEASHPRLPRPLPAGRLSAADLMMLDADVGAASPSSVWRVLHQAGRLARWKGKPSSKGKGFQQPLGPHEHWHVDISYLNLAGTFYYLCSVLDGYSRYLVHWEIREAMTEAEVEIILQRAREQFPRPSPRIISDNGPQFIARDFKEFIRLCGMTHVRTSPFYPQSNGKIERWHQSLKGECVRPGVPLSIDDARRLVGRYVDHYNRVRLHSAIGYVTPLAKLEGRAPQIVAERDRKLEAARRQRQLRRQEARVQPPEHSGEFSTAALN